ncbi:Fc.00g068070.m01.CDS01 [Cosmosporella sp. VM-42]
MSNRFVSGGTITSSGEVSKDAPPPTSTAQPAKNKEWEAVQQELEADRKRREEARVKAVTGEERSLFDILEANKAAKQAAFEEQSKLRNQFRALDDDEIDFLDEVRERKRSEEERVRKETEENLKAFRERRRKDETTAAEGDEAGVGGEEWGVGRKRKRVKGKEVKGVKRRVGIEGEGDGEKKAVGEVMKDEKEEDNEKKGASIATAPVAKKSLGLVSYGSDSDDDD